MQEGLEEVPAVLQLPVHHAQLQLLGGELPGGGQGAGRAGLGRAGSREYLVGRDGHRTSSREYGCLYCCVIICTLPIRETVEITDQRRFR